MSVLIRETIAELAAELGFQLMGVAPAVETYGYSSLMKWIERGYAGEMDYFANRREAYRHPDGVLAGTRSLLVFSFPYPAESRKGSRGGVGRVARYAWTGADYHDVIHPKLKMICRRINELVPGSKSRGVVDTAPLLEREFAQLAGMGWRGKNTLLLNKRAGSYFFLACVLTDVVLPYDQRHDSSHCGSCTACLDACPTDAFPQPGVLDATRCISYLTIEHRGAIPHELRSGIQDWVFGCDVCQEVCPWNRKPARTAEPQQFSLCQLELEALFELDDDQFRKQYRKTPLWRTRRRGILRNAAIVLGNQKRQGSVSALVRGISDFEPLVRGNCAWALGEISGSRAMSALRERLAVETDPSVISEIEAALAAQERG